MKPLILRTNLHFGALVALLVVAAVPHQDEAANAVAAFRLLGGMG